MRISVRTWPWFLFSLGAVLFLADAALKNFVYKYVEVYPLFCWGWLDLYLQCVTNQGIAWGMFQAFPKSIFVTRLFVVFGLILYYFQCRQKRNMAVCIMLILVGALGNIFDFLYYGCVIDMFHFLFWGHSYGIFNVSDFYIFMGAIGLLLCSIYNDRKRTLAAVDKVHE